VIREKNSNQNQHATSKQADDTHNPGDDEILSANQFGIPSQRFL
jgi:hypothetical protein